MFAKFSLIGFFALLATILLLVGSFGFIVSTGFSGYFLSTVFVGGAIIGIHQTIECVKEINRR